MKSYKEIYNQVSQSSGFHVVTDEERKKLWDIFLKAYSDISAVCKKHGIKPMLIGGSALGAVRHKGFIPWDEDFDFAMTRADYNHFAKIFEVEFGNRYILSAPNYSQKVASRFPKILIPNTRFVEIGMDINDELACVKLDLFIIENVPDSKLIRLLKGYKATFLMAAASFVQFYESRNGSLKNYICSTADGRKLFNRRVVIGRLLSFVSSTKWFNLADKSCQYNKETSLMSIPTGRGHYFHEICKRDTFVPVSEGIFEGNAVYLPANADAYLTNLYGDYMKIPPQQKREVHRVVEIKFSQHN